MRPGDSLWVIAERQHTTVAVLRQLNHRQGRTTIHVGQPLRVPQAANQVLPDIGRSMARYATRHLDLLRAQDTVLAGVLLLRQLLRGTRSTGLSLAGYFQDLGSVQKQGLLAQTRARINNVWALPNRFAHP